MAVERLLRAVDWMAPNDMRTAQFDARGLVMERNSMFPGLGENLENLRGPLLIGRNSYQLSGWIGGWCIVGRYCSLSNNVDLAVPMPQGATLSTREPGGDGAHASASGSAIPLTVIGCDVWMGVGACVRRGVRVGHGAVIGAQAVVTEDVPPYAVVGGHPARIIRYRFPPDLVTRLLAAQWWTLPADLVARLPKHDIETSLRIAAGSRRGR